MSSTVNSYINDNHNNSNSNQPDIEIDFPSSSEASSLNESKTNLIINYLPQDFTSDDLRMLFMRYGEIENCKLVYDKMTGESLCYGFVNFVQIDDADRALSEMNGKKIQNKCIKVSNARPSCVSIKGANLYVCGIPRDWQVADLNAFFGQCGKIITSRILTHQNSQSKGVGFIRYDFRFEAELALSRLNNTYPTADATEPITMKFANFPAAITNKQVAAVPLAASLYAPAKAQILNTTSMNLLKQQRPTSIFTPQNAYAQLTAQYNPYALAAAVAASNCLSNQHCQHLNQNQQAFTNTLTSSLANNFNIQNISAIQPTSLDGYSTCLQTPSVSTATPTTIAPQTIQPTAPQAPGWCLFVYNISPETDDNILWQLFGPFGAVQNVKIVRDYKTHKCRGYGFVTMTNYEEAVIAINALNGYPLGNRALQVSFKTGLHCF